jgi:hypothetical protein
MARNIFPPNKKFKYHNNKSSLLLLLEEHIGGGGIAPGEPLVGWQQEGILGRQ